MKYLMATLTLLTLFICGCKKSEPACQCTYAPAGNSTQWTQVLGSDTTAGSYPDRFAVYYLYRFDRTHLKNVGIKIKGYYAEARYMSYNVYNENSPTSLGSLLDVNIKPCCPGQNPYDGSRSFGKNDVYSIEVLPTGTDITGKQNVLQYDSAVDTVAIFLRYYVPQGGPAGGVTLPTVETYDIPTGTALNAPVDLNPHVPGSQQNVQALISQYYAAEPGTDLYFYHFTLNGLYNNYDNQYLAMPLTPQPGEVFVLRFKAPGYAQTASQNSTADVRYWSINQGDNYTYTYNALKDADAHVAADGFVNLVIANFDSAITAKSTGLNKMPIAIHPGTKMFLVYRNLVTRQGFSGNMSQVPILDASNLADYPNLHANDFIGNYAPVGKRMSRQDFLNNFGGVPVSY